MRRVASQLLIIPELQTVLNRYVFLDIILRTQTKKLMIRLTKASTSQRTELVESSASSSKVSKTSVAATKVGKPGKFKVGDYQYEIDCQKVADSIDVTDLVSLICPFSLQPLNFFVCNVNF